MRAGFRHARDRGPTEGRFDAVAVRVTLPDGMMLEQERRGSQGLRRFFFVAVSAEDSRREITMASVLTVLSGSVRPLGRTVSGIDR